MQGPEVAAFEREFAAAINAPQAVAVSNGTSALELSLRALGVRPGDDVITVSHSFIATANSIRAVGARPVFVDVDARTFGMDPQLVERALTERTRAILPVHQIGVPCELGPILELAQKHGLSVIEDAACAAGSEILLGGRWQRIGQPHGTLACFSFHPRKLITTGDGGMITTASADVAERLRSLRNHGIGAFAEASFNMRMTDVLAAIGRVQLGRLDDVLVERSALADAYTSCFADHPLLDVLRPPAWARTNWQSYPLLARNPTDAQRLLLHLDAHGVDARPGLTNAHEEIAYMDPSTWTCGGSSSAECQHAREPSSCNSLLVSADLRRRTVLIPLFHGMSVSEHQQVMAAVSSFR